MPMSNLEKVSEISVAICSYLGKTSPPFQCIILSKLHTDKPSKSVFMELGLYISVTTNFPHTIISYSILQPDTTRFGLHVFKISKHSEQ